MKTQLSIALVTGANRGIGRAFVEALLERGVNRVYAAARKLTDLEPVVAIDRKRVLPLKIDITSLAEINAAAEKACDVNLLINNAGIADFGSLLDAPGESIRRNMETNYFGTLHAIRSFAPVIEKNGGGAIVNLLTIVALASMPGLGVYNASKAAAWSMTQSLRADLRKRKIRVYGVFPGPVDTDMIRGVDMPKTSATDVARAVLSGIENGDEDIFPDPMAKQMYAAWKQDHKAVERQFGSM
ncbi:MAG: SDR family oxidoreductase [Acidobacteriia bacterium]|nr:SDR family oxidoreductase [Terriglobia bacterium]